MDCARSDAGIVVFCRNSSCNSSCDAIVRNGRKTTVLECNSSFAIVCVKRHSKHISSVVAAGKHCSRTPCRFHSFSKHPSQGCQRSLESQAETWQLQVSQLWPNLTPTPPSQKTQEGCGCIWDPLMGGGLQQLHLKFRTSQNGIFQRAVSSTRRCLPA